MKKWKLKKKNLIRDIIRQNCKNLCKLRTNEQRYC